MSLSGLVDVIHTLTDSSEDGAQVGPAAMGAVGGVSAL